MLKSLRVLAAAAALLLPMLAPDAAGQLKSADGEEIVVGKSWNAGTKVKSDPIGISFKVPEGCVASVDEKSWFIALKFEGSTVIGAASAMTGMDQPDAEGFLSQPANFSFLGSEISLQPSGKPSTEGHKTSVAFSGQNSAGAGIVLRGESNNAFALVIGGADADAAKIKAALESIEKSVSFLKPPEDARKSWHTKLSGRKLSVNDEANKATLVFDLGNDGNYKMTYTVGGQSQTQDGQWHVEVGVLGGLLVLKAAGVARQLRMQQTGTNLTIEGYPAQVSGGAALGRPGDPAPGLKKTDADFKSDIPEVDKLDGKDVQFDVRYEEGTQLKIALLGVSFKVPQGCIGGVTPKVNYVLVRPNDQRGLGTIAMQSGVSGMGEITAMLTGAKDLSSLEKGLVMEPDGEPKVVGAKATMRHTSAAYVSYSAGFVGPSHNSVLIAFIGPKDDDAKIKGYCEAIANSLQFAKPDDAAQRKQWNEGLKGYCLHYFNYRSSSDNKWDSTTNIYTHLGSDNTFHYIYKHEGTMVAKDRTPDDPTVDRWAGENGAEQSGTWYLEFTITGALLYLTNDKGETYPMLLQYANNQLYVNGQEVTREKSNEKK